MPSDRWSARFGRKDRFVRQVCPVGRIAADRYDDPSEKNVAALAARAAEIIADDRLARPDRTDFIMGISSRHLRSLYAAEEETNVDDGPPSALRHCVRVSLIRGAEESDGSALALLHAVEEPSDGVLVAVWLEEGVVLGFDEVGFHLKVRRVGTGRQRIKNLRLGGRHSYEKRHQGNCDERGHRGQQESGAPMSDGHRIRRGDDCGGTDDLSLKRERRFQ